MATPKTQVTGQIKGDFQEAGEHLQMALRELKQLMESKDVVIIARSAKAGVHIQNALRLMQLRGVDVRPDGL